MTNIASFKTKTSELAIASLILSLIIITPFAGLIALVLGIVALVKISKSKGRLGGRGLAIAGTIIGGIRSILLILIFIPAILTFGQYDFAENVNKAHLSLPEQATNISYSQSYLNTAYEFDISEKEFIKWVHADGWPYCTLKKIQDEPFEISRYNHSIIDDERYSDRLKDKENPTAVIKRGWYYEERQGNGGGIAVAYDSEKNRAYIQHNLR